MLVAIAGIIIAYLTYRSKRKEKKEKQPHEHKTIIAGGSVATGKSKVEHEEAGRDLLHASRDILKADGDIIVQQPPAQVKPAFPLPAALHNQTPPEPHFVGRKDVLATITQWYNDPDVRIGALIGWGGVGKCGDCQRTVREIICLDEGGGRSVFERGRAVALLPAVDGRFQESSAVAISESMQAGFGAVKISDEKD